MRLGDISLDGRLCTSLSPQSAGSSTQAWQTSCTSKPYARFEIRLCTSKRYARFEIRLGTLWVSNCGDEGHQTASWHHDESNSELVCYLALGSALVNRSQITNLKNIPSTAARQEMHVMCYIPQHTGTRTGNAHLSHATHCDVVDAISRMVLPVHAWCQCSLGAA